VFVQDPAAPDELYFGHMARDNIVRVSQLTQASTWDQSRLSLRPQMLGTMLPSDKSKDRSHTLCCVSKLYISLQQSTELFVFKMHPFAT
jgi:hypothetical protein